MSFCVLFVCSCVLYCTALHCTVLYCTVLYCTVLYCTALHCTALHSLHCTILYFTVLYCTLLYCTALYCTVLYCTVLYCTALYCALLYGTVLYYCQRVSTQLPLTNTSYHTISQYLPGQCHLLPNTSELGHSMYRTMLIGHTQVTCLLVKYKRVMGTKLQVWTWKWTNTADSFDSCHVYWRQRNKNWPITIIVQLMHSIIQT